MSGLNKRPAFDSPEHAEWFEKTPKWVLYEIVRDMACIYGPADTEQDNFINWLALAKEEQRLLKLNGII